METPATTVKKNNDIDPISWSSYFAYIIPFNAQAYEEGMLLSLLVDEIDQKRVSNLPRITVKE